MRRTYRILRGVEDVHALRHRHDSDQKLEEVGQKLLGFVEQILVQIQSVPPPRKHATFLDDLGIVSLQLQFVIWSGSSATELSSSYRDTSC